jgi:hypothetical protein
VNYQKVLKQSWDIVWRYRALWLFGAILALTTANGFFFAANPDWEVSRERIAVKLSENSTIYIPGEGPDIDLTRPYRDHFRFDADEWEDLRRLFDEELSGERIPQGVWAILITLGVVAAGMTVFGILGRYTAEAALIRMVHEDQETGEKAGILRGLRMGFSRSAWRLFLIDILVNLPMLLALLLAFGLALLPILFWALGSTAAGVTGALLTFGGVFLVIILSIIVSAALSLFVQVIRRACVVEGLGVLASIGRGFGMVRRHFKEVVAIWLIWIGTRLAWMFASVPVLILISPILLLFVIAGVAVGAVPAVLVGGLLSTTLAEPFAWAVGILAGLPLLLLVTLTPMLFLGGLVEVFKSSTWTLAYRELCELECTAADEVPSAGAALEAASAS